MGICSYTWHPRKINKDIETFTYLYSTISVYNGHKKRLSAGIWCGVVIGMESKWINRKFMFSVWVRNIYGLVWWYGYKLCRRRMLHYFSVRIINFWKLTRSIRCSEKITNRLVSLAKRDMILFQAFFFTLSHTLVCDNLQ